MFLMTACSVDSFTSVLMVVELQTAIGYTILAETGISTVPVSQIQGNIGDLPQLLLLLDSNSCLEHLGCIWYAYLSSFSSEPSVFWARQIYIQQHLFECVAGFMPSSTMHQRLEPSLEQSQPCRPHTPLPWGKLRLISLNSSGVLSEDLSSSPSIYSQYCHRPRRVLVTISMSSRSRRCFD